MVANKVIQDFKAPPLVLNAATSFTKESVKLPASFDYGLLMNAIIVVFIIAVLIIVGAGVFAYKRFAPEAEEGPKQGRFAFKAESEGVFGLFKKKKEGL